MIGSAVLAGANLSVLNLNLLKKNAIQRKSRIQTSKIRLRSIIMNFSYPFFLLWRYKDKKGQTNWESVRNKHTNKLFVFSVSGPAI